MPKIRSKDQQLGDPLGLRSSPYDITENNLWSYAAIYADWYCHDQKTRGYPPEVAVFPFLRSNYVIIIPLTWPNVREHIVYTLVNYYINLGVCKPKGNVQ